MKTLVDALDTYIVLISRENKIAGVPIRFFIRHLSKAEIAKCWLKRYYPAPDSEKEQQTKSARKRNALETILFVIYSC